MQKRLGEVLQSAKGDIARAWAERVSQSSQRYRSRPFEEIESTASRLVEGLVEAVVLGSYEIIEECLVSIVESRSALGFDPSEVQRAVLMGCQAVFPTLEKAFGDDAQQLVWSVTQVERAIHRTLNILNKVYHEARMKGMASEAEQARASTATAEGRLEAVLGALGHGAIVVNPNLVVVWADERASSARYGAIAPGELHTCDPQRPDGACLLAAAAETGEIQRGQPADECSIWLAIPVKSETGEVVEIVGLMGTKD